MCGGDYRQMFRYEAYSGGLPDEPYQAAAAFAPAKRRTGVTFEYQGMAAKTVVSPITGRTYRFTHPGARVSVDPRDTAWLTFTPNLMRAF